MKKIISILFMLLATILSMSAHDKTSIKDNLQGTWTDNNNIQFTFKGDSLFIDEIDNEGFCYTYKAINHDTISINNTFDTFNMTIISLDKTTLIYYFDNKKETYTLTRKE